MSGLFGDWDKFEKLLEGLKDGKPKYDNAVIGLGERIATKVKQNIEYQELDFAPLAEEYLKRKVAEGYDSRTLIRTGDFVDDIIVKDIVSTGDSLMVFVGVQGGMTETGISMEELAEFIEFGTENQPARLPFTQSWEMMKSEIKSEVADKIKMILKEELSV